MKTNYLNYQENDTLYDYYLKMNNTTILNVFWNWNKPRRLCRWLLINKFTSFSRLCEIQFLDYTIWSYTNKNYWLNKETKIIP